MISTKRRVKAGATRASESRCPTCGSAQTTKDLACLRCAANATLARRVEDDSHECGAPGCTARIANRYKLVLCAEHSLVGARAERAREAAERAAAYAKRVEQGRALAQQIKEQAAAGQLTHYLDGSPIRGRARLHVERELEAGTPRQAIRESVEQMRRPKVMTNAEANPPATGADGATQEDVMSKANRTQQNATPAAAPATTKRPATTERAKAEPKAKAPKAEPKKAAAVAPAAPEPKVKAVPKAKAVEAPKAAPVKEQPKAKAAAKAAPAKEPAPKPATERKGNLRIEDDEVLAHIAAAKKADPEAKMGAVLSALHASGRACNPVRFRALFTTGTYVHPKDLK